MHHFIVSFESGNYALVRFDQCSNQVFVFHKLCQDEISCISIAKSMTCISPECNGQCVCGLALLLRDILEPFRCP